MQLLIIDDDPVVAKIIGKTLKISYLHCEGTSDTLSALPNMPKPTAIFLDINLVNHGNGLDLIPALRCRWQFVPIIVVTSRVDSADIGAALSRGANDFMRKPLTSEDLKARYETRIKEAQTLENLDEIRLGDIVLHKAQRMISGPLGQGHLSPTEFLIVELLAENPGRTVARDKLIEQCWQGISVSANALDKKVHKARKELAQATRSLQIATVYGEGLALTASEGSPTVTHS